MRIAHGMGALALAGLLGAGTIGCAETSRTQETRVESSSSDDGSNRSATRETTVVAEDKDTCHGVLSCTVDFVGDVVAFPFRLVGGLAGAIF